MKTKKTFRVVDNEGQHEYDIAVEIIEEGEEFTLFRSLDSYWAEHVRGDKVLSLVDNGNGVVLSKKIDEMDYSEILELSLLLNFHRKYEKNNLERVKYSVSENILLFKI